MQPCRSSKHTISGQKWYHHSHYYRLNDWQVLEILRNLIKAMIQRYATWKRNSIMPFFASFLIGFVSRGSQDFTGWYEFAYNLDKLRPFSSFEPLSL